MKKAITIALVLVMVFALAACGGGNSSTDAGNNTDDPLNHPSNNTPSATPEASEPAANGQVPDLAEIIGGNGKLSDLDNAEKQAVIEAARADGVTVEFNSDGSTVIIDADGQKSVQNPDGIWTFEEEDGTYDVQIGGDWPDNEFTKLLPKPDFAVLNGASTTEESFAVSFPGTTIEQTKAYAEKVKDKGFTEDADTTDEQFGGIAVYLYSANNGNGYQVELTFSGGQTLLSITKI